MATAGEPALITDYHQAVAFLDARIGHGIMPGLERIAGLLEVMRDPHRGYPVIHVAGTNGKTSVVRMIDALLTTHGLSVGSFTSPHLHRIEERFAIRGSAMTSDEFVESVASVAPFVTHYEAQAASPVTYFELTTAIAFEAFSSSGVDVAVVEVGLGGRLDATNVVVADVAVITGIAHDHEAFLGDSLGAIAAEKAAIVDGGGFLVSGPLPAAAEGAITARVAEAGAKWVRAGADFATEDVSQAVGGWAGTIVGLKARYEDIFLPLHGRHQFDHLATAVATVEAFFDRALDGESVREAAAAVTSPGRLEVVARHPLVLIDGAHNREGFEGLADALDAEFRSGGRVLVMGVRGDRNPEDLLAPLKGRVSHVVATAPDGPSALPPARIADAARRSLGSTVGVDVVESVPTALDRACQLAGDAGMVIVAGSLYVAGEARAHLMP